MAPCRRVLVLIAALALLAPGTAFGDDGYDPTAPAQPFLGIDGKTHDPAPLVVPGSDGELFGGPDFDIACRYGARLGRGMHTLQRVARVIRASGRRVIWTVGPDKESVLGSRLPAALPHGSCDERGLAEQNTLLDTFDDPSYLPLRQRLSRDRRQVYWKTDPHWTTVGGARYAAAVARELDPVLARRQKYAYGTEARVGGYTLFLGEDSPEILETARPVTRVTVRTAPDSASDWAGYPNPVWDHSWVSSPRGRTWPGHTLLLGDSFTQFGLPALRPLFRHGRYLWVNGVPAQTLIDGIVDADTVVLEVVQNFLLLDQPVLQRSFRHQLRRALTRH